MARSSNHRAQDIAETLGAARRHTRVPVNHEFASIEEFIAEYVRDISQGGVFIRTDAPLPRGTPVDLRFTIISDEIETVEGHGVVVRVEPPGGTLPAGMGVAFEQLTTESQAVVDRLTAEGRRPG